MLFTNVLKLLTNENNRRAAILRTILWTILWTANLWTAKCNDKEARIWKLKEFRKRFLIEKKI